MLKRVNYTVNKLYCPEAVTKNTLVKQFVVLKKNNSNVSCNFTLDTSSFPLFSLMNTFSNSGLIPSTLQGTRETDDFGTEIFDSGIGTDRDPVAYWTKESGVKLFVIKAIKN